MESAPQLLLQIYILAIKVKPKSNAANTIINPQCFDQDECSNWCAMMNATFEELISNSSLLTANSFYSHHQRISTPLTNEQRNLH